jgi:hypothetical protein
MREPGMAAQHITNITRSVSDIARMREPGKADQHVTNLTRFSFVTGAGLTLDLFRISRACASLVRRIGAYQPYWILIRDWRILTVRRQILTTVPAVAAAATLGNVSI